jgi:hypothetical protein
MTFPTGEIMFDRDDTVMLSTNSSFGGVTEFGTAAKEQVRDISNGSNVINLGGGGWAFLFFPEPMDLTHFFIAASEFNLPQWAMSKDANTPATGTWTSATSYPSMSRASIANSANPYQMSGDPTDIVAIRWRVHHAFARAIQNIRIWGRPSNPSTYLQIWDESLDQPAATNLFNFGQIGRGLSEDISFRVRNMHETLQVGGVTLSTPNGFGPNAPANNCEFDDGGGFANPLNIGALDPEEISNVITMRFNTDEADTLGGRLVSVLIDGTWA